MSRGFESSAVERRIALRAIVSSALLPLALLSPCGVTAATGRSRIAAPDGRFALTRVLTRGLSGGAVIVVTRRWRIGFVRADTDGLTVEGAQIFADVSAPPALAALTEIERTRSTSAMFPILLDEFGMIRGYGDAAPQALPAGTLETARALIAAMPIGDAERQDASAMLTRLSQLGAHEVSRLPRDLFFPRTGSDTVSQEIPLPGQQPGVMIVTASATAEPHSGLLVASERSIVTRLGTGERRTIEQWALAPD